MEVLEYIKKTLMWGYENGENIFALLITIGVLFESINALFPTVNKNSFLEKAGSFVSWFTNKLPSVLFAKLPTSIWNKLPEYIKRQIEKEEKDKIK